MQINCPACHAAFPLEAALQHEVGREVVAMLAGMQPQLALPLLHYIGFFRPAKQQLGWGRALKLMQEVVMLLPCPVDMLVEGLTEAARTLDVKRAQPGWKPLGNHNYLSACLGSVQARQGPAVGGAAGTRVAEAAFTTAAPPAARSRAGQSLIALEGMKR